MSAIDTSLPRAAERALRFLGEAHKSRLTLAAIELPTAAQGAQSFAARFAAPERTNTGHRYLEPDDVKETMDWLVRPRVRTEFVEVEKVVERRVYVPVETPARVERIEVPAPAEKGSTRPYSGMDESVRRSARNTAGAAGASGTYLSGLSAASGAGVMPAGGTHAVSASTATASSTVHSVAATGTFSSVAPPAASAGAPGQASGFFRAMAPGGQPLGPSPTASSGFFGTSNSPFSLVARSIGNTGSVGGSPLAAIVQAPVGMLARGPLGMLAQGPLGMLARTPNGEQAQPAYGVSEPGRLKDSAQGPEALLAQGPQGMLPQGLLGQVGQRLASMGLPIPGLASPVLGNDTVVSRLAPIVQEAVQRANGGPALAFRLPGVTKAVAMESGLGVADQIRLDRATQVGLSNVPSGDPAALGQISLVAPDLILSSPEAAAAGSAVSMQWSELAAGAGTLDEAALARLGPMLPAQAQLIYPALPVGTPGAANLALSPSLIGRFMGSYGPTATSMAIAEAARSGTSAAPSKGGSSRVAASIVPVGRPSVSGPGGLFGGKGNALEEVGGQAKRGGALDFLGVPVRMAPSLAGNSGVRQERSLAKAVASGSGGAPVRPEAFGLLRQRLFPNVGTIDAEPDLPAWQRRAQEVGLRDTNPASLLAPDARAPKPNASAMPQMGGGPLAQAARPYAPGLALAEAAGALPSRSRGQAARTSGTAGFDSSGSSPRPGRLPVSSPFFANGRGDGPNGAAGTTGPQGRFPIGMSKGVPGQETPSGLFGAGMPGQAFASRSARNAGSESASGFRMMPKAAADAMDMARASSSMPPTSPTSAPSNSTPAIRAAGASNKSSGSGNGMGSIPSFLNALASGTPSNEASTAGASATRSASNPASVAPAPSVSSGLPSLPTFGGPLGFADRIASHPLLNPGTSAKDLASSSAFPTSTPAARTISSSTPSARSAWTSTSMSSPSPSALPAVPGRASAAPARSIGNQAAREGTNRKFPEGFARPMSRQTDLASSSSLPEASTSMAIPRLDVSTPAWSPANPAAEKTVRGAPSSSTSRSAPGRRNPGLGSLPTGNAGKPIGIPVAMANPVGRPPTGAASFPLPASQDLPRLPSNPVPSYVADALPQLAANLKRPSPSMPAQIGSISVPSKPVERPAMPVLRRAPAVVQRSMIGSSGNNNFGSVAAGPSSPNPPKTSAASAAGSSGAKKNGNTGDDGAAKVQMLAREVYGILRRRIRDEMERTQPHGRF